MSTLIEAGWDDARRRAIALAARLGTETVNVYEAADRVLAEDVVAKCALPSSDTSAMDGWAVCGEGPWRIVGDALAGSPYAAPLAAGETVRIATGGVLPSGAQAVLRWEDATVEADLVSGVVTVGRDIRPAGEECQAGEVLARDGERISPVLAGYFAATGHDEIIVARRPQVSVLLLGDELLSAGVPHDGMVRDSLGPQLPSWLRRMGAEFLGQDRSTDDFDGTVSLLGDAVHRSDVVVTTGGTAAGPRDHLHAAVQALGGELVVDKVRVRPGHPMMLAVLPDGVRRVPVVGLPGNPHSAIVGLMTLGAPIIHGLLGMATQEPLMMPLGEDVRAAPGATRLVASRVHDGVIVTSAYGGSAMLRGLSRSTGFAVIAKEQARAGELVEWIPLPE